MYLNNLISLYHCLHALHNYIKLCLFLSTYFIVLTNIQPCIHADKETDLEIKMASK